MTVKHCEACGAPIWKPGPGQLLCDLCMKVINEQIDLLLEMRYFDPAPEDE